MTTWTGTVPTIASGDTTTVPTNLATYRDALKAVSEAWTSYVPVWTGITTNPVLGNGTLVGAYARINKLTFFRIVLTMGSTTTMGSGGWVMTPPVAPVTSATPVPLLCNYYDTGSAFYGGHARFFTSGNIFLYADASSAGGALRNATGTIPFTFGTGDQVIVSGEYEAA